MKRGGPLKRRTPLRRRSARKADQDRILERNKPRAIARDGWCCGRCRSGTALHVHHLLPRSAGGGHEMSNLKTLCESCHRWVHSHPLQAEAEGLLLRRRAA